MEGAIKLLQFCLEQKEAGNYIFMTYSPHVDWFDMRIYNDGKFDMGGRNEQTWGEHYYASDLTPERADQIINEIKEKLK